MKQRKKLVLILAVVCGIFCVQAAQAQEGNAGSASGFHWGLKAGFGVSSLNVNQAVLGTERTTFVVGGLAEYRLFDWFSGGLGVEYTQNGGGGLSSHMFYIPGSPMHRLVYDDGIYQENIRTDLLIHTLEVPVNLRFSTPQLGEFKPFVLFGPSFGFHLNSTVTNYRKAVIEDDAYGTETPATSSSDKVSDKVEKFNTSFHFGTGTEFSAYGLTFELGVSYRLGLYNQNKFLNSVYQQYGSNSFIGYVAVKF